MVYIYLPSGFPWLNGCRLGVHFHESLLRALIKDSYQWGYSGFNRWSEKMCLRLCVCRCVCVCVRGALSRAAAGATHCVQVLDPPGPRTRRSDCGDTRWGPQVCSLRANEPRRSNGSTCKPSFIIYPKRLQNYYNLQGKCLPLNRATIWIAMD